MNKVIINIEYPIGLEKWMGRFLPIICLIIITLVCIGNLMEINNIQETNTGVEALTILGELLMYGILILALDQPLIYWLNEKSLNKEIEIDGVRYVRKL